MRLSYLSRLVLGVSLLGCHDLTGNQTLPAGTQDPSYYNNATGALGMRNTAVVDFGTMLPGYIVTAALLTDELTDVSTIAHTGGTNVQSNGQVNNPLDERILPELAYGVSGLYASDQVYNQLQGARTLLLQAIGQLAVYDTSAKDTVILPPVAGRALRGELYALYGYTEILLADLFCSGIPLSTLDFQHDFTYRAGSPRDSVYWDAIAKFDTALALSADSVRIQYLARVGLGRTYLDLHLAIAAADDVTQVPVDFQYQLSEAWSPGCSDPNTNVITCAGVVTDREGGHGLPYLTNGDPRTADTTVTFPYGTIMTSDISVTAGYPRVYAAGWTGYAPVTVASGVEARLIQAEAALQQHDVSGWLTDLNDLRASAPIPGVTVPLPDRPDSLPPLSDPGTALSGAAADSARVALMFSERAAWLYMTGHRQGDLRRQLRQYPQYWPDQSTLYPTGPYLGLGAGFYGTDVTAPIPAAEYINPLFHGCRNRDP